MTKEAIILAGGMGTRLKDVLVDLPKPMAPIRDRPFLAFVFDYLIAQGITKTHLSVGYKKEAIIDTYGHQYQSLELVYAPEDEPLGTGGAIKNACLQVRSDEVFVINGDTLFPVNLKKMAVFYESTNASLTIALKSLTNFDRYGTVEIEKNGRITGFAEKKYKEQGLINGGIYLMNTNLINELSLPKKFSFEKDVMEQHYATQPFFGLAFEDYFIDIGIPEDYERAQHEL